MLQMLAVLFRVTLVCVNKRIHFYTRSLEVKEVLLTWQHLLKQQVQDDTRTDFEVHFCSACTFLTSS